MAAPLHHGATAFVWDDLQTMLQDLFTRYGGAEGDAFKLAVACYPKGEDHD